MNWHILYLRPRCEKKIADHCRILGLSYYLPLRKELKIYQRRRVVVEKPVFPGYIFLSFMDKQLLPLLQTNHVLKVIQPLNEKTLLRELVHIRKALAVDPALVSCVALRKGRRVRITAGPFLGVEGLVWSCKNNAKVRLNVDMIGQAVAVEVDKDFIEILD